MTPAVSLQSVCFGYDHAHSRDKDPDAPGKLTLSDLSFEISKGSVTALLGANGVGKTTLLYLLLDLYPSSSGTIQRFAADGTLCEAQAVKKLMGMVSQEESIPFDLSVEEYVLLGRAPHLKLLELPKKLDREIVMTALNTVGMAHLAGHAATRISSGEKQLAGMARVLAQSPEILLFDEPCSHLDLINTRRTLSIMKNIARKGHTVIFTTHDPNAAAAIADHVILLYKGRIIGEGTVSETLTSPLLSRTYGDVVEVTQTSKGPVVLAI